MQTIVGRILKGFEPQEGQRIVCVTYMLWVDRRGEAEHPEVLLPLDTFILRVPRTTRNSLFQ